MELRYGILCFNNRKGIEFRNLNIPPCWLASFVRKMGHFLAEGIWYFEWLLDKVVIPVGNIYGTICFHDCKKK